MAPKHAECYRTGGEPDGSRPEPGGSQWDEKLQSQQGLYLHNSSFDFFPHIAEQCLIFKRLERDCKHTFKPHDARNPTAAT